MKDYIHFFRQFREQFHTTGAIAPSSRFLAKAIARPLANAEKPVRVLEVGPGTGAATQQIVQLLSAGDQFDLVEINSSFAELIKEQFQSNEQYKRVAEISEVHVCALQDFEPDGLYDFIISGLPLNNFPPELVSEFFEIFANLLKPGGTLSYFEYMFVRSLRKTVSKNMRNLDAVIAPQVQQFRIERDWVFINLPPAWVQHLQFVSSAEAEHARI